jgi:hypothetical protein
MEYHPYQPHGQAIMTDPYFTLMADIDGVGFIHCSDGVLVIPPTTPSCLNKKQEILLSSESITTYQANNIHFLDMRKGPLKPGPQRWGASL